MQDEIWQATGAGGVVWMPADWPAPANVFACVTSRMGGFSQRPYAGFNLGTHVADDLAAVRRNRLLLRKLLPQASRLQWLHQIHGTRVACVEPGQHRLRPRTADAAAIFAEGDAAAVLTADCLPVFLSNRSGTAAAVVHAGWRGLLAGVIESAVSALNCPSDQLMAWFGPAIGPCHFEVGAELKPMFLTAEAAAGKQEQTAAAFTPHPRHDSKWLLDIYSLAALRLQAVGVNNISGGGLCTVCDQRHCYSYRRDGVTGRMASVICLESTAC